MPFFIIAESGVVGKMHVWTQLLSRPVSQNVTRKLGADSELRWCVYPFGWYEIIKILYLIFYLTNSLTYAFESQHFFSTNLIQIIIILPRRCFFFR